MSSLDTNIYQTTGLVAAKYSPPGLFGDHIRKVPPVPIPNTVVKLSEPMIVPTSAKVGIAEFLKPFLVFGLRRVFLCPYFSHRKRLAMEWGYDAVHFPSPELLLVLGEGQT